MRLRPLLDLTKEATKGCREGDEKPVPYRNGSAAAARRKADLILQSHLPPSLGLLLLLQQLRIMLAP
jgi:hypothetical protein